MKNDFKKRNIFIILLLGLLFSNLVLAEPITDDLHLNIQTTNSTGSVVTGPFAFVFNISNNSDCAAANVVYSNSTTLTTDTRGIISYYLGDINLSFSEQYWLCYYRNGTLINNSKIARTPYAFTAKNISAEGVLNDSNLDLTGKNITASSGLFTWLGSLASKITKLFVIDINASGNITADYFFGNGSQLTGISYTESDPYWSANYTLYNTTWSTDTTYSHLSNFTDDLDYSDKNVNNSQYLDGYDSSYFMPLNTSVVGNFTITGSLDIDGDWQSGGVTIDGGDIYAQTGYFYNITSLNVTKQNLTIIDNLTIGGHLFSSGTGDNYFMGSLGIGTSTPGSKLTVWEGDLNVSNAARGQMFYVQNSTGNVGIGTASPDSHLHIYDATGDTTLRIETDKVNGISQTRFMNDAQTWIARLDSDDGFKIRDATTPANPFTIEAGAIANTLYLQATTGNVGIGTANPGAPLEVRGEIAVSDSTDTHLRLAGRVGAIPDTADSFIVTTTDEGAYPFLEYGHLVLGPRTDQPRDIVFMAGNGAEVRMVIRDDGNVGIGDTTPGKLLTVGSSGITDGKVGIYGNGSGSDTLGDGQLAIGLDADYWEFRLTATPLADLAIDRIHAGTDYEVMRIQRATGNVGIGTTSPSQKLEVSGGYILADNFNATSEFLTAVGVDAGKLNTGNWVTAIGYQAGYSNVLPYLTAVGHSAGYNNTGNSLTAIGYSAGRLNNGSWVTVIGRQAGHKNIGNASTGVGIGALENNIGNNVVTIGYQAGKDNTVADQFIVKHTLVNAIPLIQGNFSSGYVGIGTASSSQKLDVNGSINLPNDQTIKFGGGDMIKRWESNAAIAVGKNTGADTQYSSYFGDYAGQANEGNYTTGIGNYAGGSNLRNYLTAVGYRAGEANSGFDATAIGSYAGYQSGAHYLTAVGYYAGRSNSGDSLTATGYYAGYDNSGAQSTATGYYAGYDNSGNLLTAAGFWAGYKNTGAQVTAIGAYAGQSNNESTLTAIGYNSGNKNNGSAVTAIGSNAGYRNTGDYLTALGYGAGYLNTRDDVTVIGFNAGESNIGNSLTVLGYYSGYENTGNYSIGIGWETLKSNTGNDVVAIGDQAGEGNTLSDQFIVKQTRVNAIPLIQGNFSSGNVGIGTASPDEKLHINGSGGTEIKVENTDSNNWALFGMGTDNNVRAAYLLTYGSNHSTAGNHTALKNLWGDILFFTGTGGAGNTEKMRITSDGNVGIGTTSPLLTLHVNSSLGGGIRLESSSQKYGFISSKGNLHLSQNSYYNGTNWVTIETGTSGGFQTNVQSDEAFRVFSNTTSLTAESPITWNPLMVVKTDGKVGIGTTSPTHDLNVVGNVNITGNLTVGGLGQGVPAGAIMAFNSASCPVGWIPADGNLGTPDLRGLFVRGAGTSTSYTMANGTAFSAAFDTYQNDSFQAHSHQANRITQGGTATMWASWTNSYGTPVALTYQNIQIQDPVASTQGTPRTGAETRPASYALTYCQKTTEDSGDSTTIWGVSGDDVVLNNQSQSLSLANTPTTYYAPNASEESWGTFHTHKEHLLNNADPTGPTTYTITCSNVPDGTKGVWVYFYHDTLSQGDLATAYLREYGTTTEWARTVPNPGTGASYTTSMVGKIPLDSSKRFDVYAGHDGIEKLHVYIRGYYI